MIGKVVDYRFDISFAEGFVKLLHQYFAAALARGFLPWNELDPRAKSHSW
jgi:hypothetical protein